jgi:hypothetical protein
MALAAGAQKVFLQKRTTEPEVAKAAIGADSGTEVRTALKG